MSHNEFMAWAEFYRAHPFDDLHRYHRPAALISTSLGGGELQPRLDWLAPEAAATSAPEPAHEDIQPGQYSQADLNTFKAFGMKPPIRKH